MGKVTSKASTETGLSTSTLVVMGGGDVQLGAAGLGVVKEGQVAILGGSFWQQVVNIKSSVKPPIDMSIRVNPHVVEGLSQAEGITFFSGLIMRWFRDAFCDLEKLEAKEKGVDTYAILEANAKKCTCRFIRNLAHFLRCYELWQMVPCKHHRSSIFP